MHEGNSIAILITTQITSILQAGSFRHFTVIILVQEGGQEKKIVHDPSLACSIISHWAVSPATRQLIFISPHDNMQPAQLALAIHLSSTEEGAGITLLVPYLPPPAVSYEKQDLPKYGQRLDGRVRSFMLRPRYWRSPIAAAFFAEPGRLAFELCHVYLNDIASTNINVLQVGKPASSTATSIDAADLLKRSLLIIPQAGPLALLYRCLQHLDQETALPATVSLCFDDEGYQEVQTGHYKQLSARLRLFKNRPLQVGPYPARHYSIAQTDMDYIFFQDGDDISAPARFARQIEELERRGLDMIGSHEIRMDEFERAILIFRYPLDVSESLSALCFHPLFHPTSLIRRSAYLRTGGFSTNLRFGYDSQFLLRSHFYLKTGNIDDFCYLRFKRPDSLTTAAATHMDSYLRQFLIKRWSTDFRLIIEDKLDLQDSSLSLQKHDFDYELMPLLVPAESHTNLLQSTRP